MFDINDPVSAGSGCTASQLSLSSNPGKPTSGSLRQRMGMHGTCIQLLLDLRQITTCDGHCWHPVMSRGYPGRALASVYCQQSPAPASWPTKHTGETKKRLTGRERKERCLRPSSSHGGVKCWLLRIYVRNPLTNPYPSQIYILGSAAVFCLKIKDDSN